MSFQLLAIGRRVLFFAMAFGLVVMGLSVNAQASTVRSVGSKTPSALATAKWVNSHCTTLVVPSVVQADLKIAATPAPTAVSITPNTYYQCGYSQHLPTTAEPYAGVSILISPDSTPTNDITSAKEFADYARSRGSHGKIRPDLGTQAFEDSENGYLEVFAYQGTVFVDIEANETPISYGSQAVLIRHIFSLIAAAGY